MVGAGGIEALNDALCEKAWDEFRRIESEGGALKSLAAGHIQERISGTRDERLRKYRDGEHAIVGTTLYPADKERPVRTLSARTVPPPEDGAVFCDRLPAARIDEGLGENA